MMKEYMTIDDAVVAIDCDEIGLNDTFLINGMEYIWLCDNE